MRVSIASFIGGIHLFELARELDGLGALDRYYTAMPSFKVTGVTRSRVATHPSVLLPHFALQLARLQRFQSESTGSTTEAFDRWLTRRQAPCDVFHVASSYGLRAMRRAKACHGSWTVCDRGSSHIRMQDELLREEVARTRVDAPPTDPRFIAKEEAEYDEADAIFVPSTFARQSFLRGRHRGRDKVVAIPIGIQAGGVLPCSQARRYVSRAFCRDDLGEKRDRIPARGDVATRAAEQRGGPARNALARIARDSVALRRSVHRFSRRCREAGCGTCIPRHPFWCSRP